MTECGTKGNKLVTHLFLKESLSNRKNSHLAVSKHSKSSGMTVKGVSPFWPRAWKFSMELSAMVSVLTK